MERRHAGYLFAVLAAGVVSLTGCASKGFVRSQVAELRTEVESQDAQLRGDVDAVRETAATAGEDAMAAGQAARDARLLALGRVDFEEIDAKIVQFAFDDAGLSETARATLSGVSELLRTNQAYHVELFGYADPSGTESYNDWLSNRRATAVMKYLVAEAGAALSRFTIIAMGEIDDLPSPEENRRVFVRVVEQVDPEAPEGMTGMEQPTELSTY